MTNDKTIQTTLNKLAALADRAVELRNKTKAEHDMSFLRTQFGKIITNDAKKDEKYYKDFCATLKILSSSYSVARTINPDKINKALCKFLIESIKTFNTFNKESTIKKHLFNDILFNPICAKKKRTVSFFSKSAYYLTQQNFPIYDVHADKGLNHFFDLHLKEHKITKIKTRKLDKYEIFFYNYKVLLNLVKDIKFKNNNPIDSIDAFFWLYGIMNSTNKDKLWYSQTCGYVGNDKFQNWYKKAQELIDDK